MSDDIFSFDGFLNVIVESASLRDSDAEYFGDEPAMLVPEGTDMLQLLVELGSFPSRGQARKNWKGPVEIPPGWTETKIGKRWLFVLNPIP